MVINLKNNRLTRRFHELSKRNAIAEIKLFKKHHVEMVSHPKKRLNLCQRVRSRFPDLTLVMMMYSNILQKPVLKISWRILSAQE
jgi:hypothetical protein